MTSFVIETIAYTETVVSTTTETITKFILFETTVTKYSYYTITSVSTVTTTELYLSISKVTATEIYLSEVTVTSVSSFTTTVTVTLPTTAYETVTVHTVHYICPAKTFQTSVDSWHMQIITLKPRWTLHLNCEGEGTVALGENVYWAGMTVNGERRIVVQQADRILPCPAGLITENARGYGKQITVAVVGPASITLEMVPPPGAMTYLR
ncbi:MAG: hypothetical protein GXO07_01810 [Crenarchaeota archaeon]|nr:hypothetical protein [Thermoproteota archaeon]